MPQAPLLQLPQLQALAALQRWDDVDVALPAVAQSWGADPRFGVAVGQMGFARGDLRLLDAAALAEKSTGPLEKLADLAFLAGDSQQERSYREAVNGRLKK